jgi:Cu-Zn family superoxide dismutase
MGQRATIALLTVAGVLGATGTALADPSPPATSSVTFQRYVPGAAGITYDTDALPIGSHAAVLSVPDRHGTTTILWLHGLLPNHAYGAHVHQNPCGADADAAGPHFQHTPDPVQPSVDPQYANPHNEIWLDLTTDAMGNATSASTVDWQFTDRHAGSVVIHAEHTHTDPGHAGTAGPRLACVTVAF